MYGGPLLSSENHMETFARNAKKTWGEIIIRKMKENERKGRKKEQRK